MERWVCCQCYQCNLCIGNRKIWHMRSTNYSKRIAHIFMEFLCKPHKQYPSILDFLLACMEPIQEADEDEQNGKPICKAARSKYQHGIYRRFLKIEKKNATTSPMLMPIPLIIWDTEMQLQHISFQQSNDQDIQIPPTLIAKSITTQQRKSLGQQCNQTA